MIPSSSWLTINHKTGELSGTPFLSHFDDLTFEFIVRDRQGASDSKVITIPRYNHTVSEKLHCQIVLSPMENLYYAKIESVKEAEFKYSLYSINGILLFSSSIFHLSEGTYYLPVDMSKFPSGVYIFSGYEDNIIQHSVKFVK